MAGDRQNKPSRRGLQKAVRGVRWLWTGGATRGEAKWYLIERKNEDHRRSAWRGPAWTHAVQTPPRSNLKFSRGEQRRLISKILRWKKSLKKAVTVQRQDGEAQGLTSPPFIYC